MELPPLIHLNTGEEIPRDYYEYDEEEMLEKIRGSLPESTRRTRNNFHRWAKPQLLATKTIGKM